MEKRATEVEGRGDPRKSIFIIARERRLLAMALCFSFLVVTQCLRLRLSLSLCLRLLCRHRNAIGGESNPPITTKPTYRRKLSPSPFFLSFFLSFSHQWSKNRTQSPTDFSLALFLCFLFFPCLFQSLPFFFAFSIVPLCDHLSLEITGNLKA